MPSGVRLVRESIHEVAAFVRAFSGVWFEEVGLKQGCLDLEIWARHHLGEYSD
jgi:hypothetical protein